MYRLLHWLFGWDYIQWRNTADQGIARVRVDGRGVVWYWRYRLICAADRITSADQVLWMTCSPDKYMKADAILAERNKP